MSVDIYTGAQSTCQCYATPAFFFSNGIPMFVFKVFHLETEKKALEDVFTVYTHLRSATRGIRYIRSGEEQARLKECYRALHLMSC